MNRKTMSMLICFGIICIFWILFIIAILIFFFKFANKDFYYVLFSFVLLLLFFIVFIYVSIKNNNKRINEIKNTCVPIKIKFIDAFYCFVSKGESSYINAYFIFEDILNNKKYAIDYKQTKIPMYSYFGNKIKFNYDINDEGDLWIKNTIESPYSSENNTIRFKYRKKFDEYFKYCKDLPSLNFQPKWTNLNKNNDVTILNNVTFVDGYYELK